MSFELEEGGLKKCIDTLYQVNIQCDQASEAVFAFAQTSVKRMGSEVFVKCFCIPLSNENLLTISFSQLSNDDDELIAFLDEFLPYKSEDMSTKDLLVCYLPSTLDAKHIAMAIAKEFLNKSKDVTLLFNEGGESIPVEIK